MDLFKMNYLLIIWQFLWITVMSEDISNIIQGCGTTKGCFIAPPNCENSPNLVCTSIFTWTAQNDGIQFFIAGTPTNYAPGENGVPVSDLYYYVAVAFSLDEFMGADTVITCITGNDVSPPTSSSINTNLTTRNQKPGNILVSWNDATENYIIFDASDSIIRVGNVGMQNSRISCNGFWNFSGRKNIRHPERTYDLSSPNMKWHILVARGTADRNTYALNIHSVLDDESFPWIIRDTINFCTDNGCGGNFIPYKDLKSAYQSYPLRTIKHKVAASHAMVMYLCWWILITTSILFARFGKGYNVHFMGAAIWFQVHRFLNLFAFCCITVVFFLIYWGHRWRVIDCSETCSLEEYDQQVHTIIGTVTYAFLILQVLMGMLRPGLDSPIRWYFNFIHKLNGLLIWVGATITMFLGVALGKTGLRTFYNGWPYFIMSVVVMVFILVWVICERIVFPWKFVPKVYENDEKRSDEEKLFKQKINLSKSLPLLLIFVHWLVGIAGAAALGKMLVNAMRGYGFDV